MNTRTLVRVPSLVLAAALGAAFAAAETAPDGVVRDGIAVQKGRNEHVQSRGKKAFYTERWDLSGLPAYKPERRVFGALRMWGSNYFFDGNVGKLWEDGFRKYQPDVTFTTCYKSPAADLPSLYTGVADIGVGGGMDFNALEVFERHFNYDPLEITVMTGSFDVPGWSNALCIFVNGRNPISRMTMRQLDDIWGAERAGGWVGTTWHPEFARGPEENIRTWGQLGLTGEWADKRINLYGNNLDYGQAHFFSDKVLKGSEKWNEHLTMYANYVRPDGSFAIGANLLIRDLGKDPYGIAYSGPQNLTPETKVLALQVADGGPYIMPSIQTVHDRTYPLIYGINLHVNRPPGMPTDPQVKEYLRYVLSREGQEVVQRDGKWLPLTADMVAEQLKKLE
jgi:phosphate transport system substrate-binding protein